MRIDGLAFLIFGLALLSLLVQTLGSNNLEPESINYLHRRKDYGDDKKIYGEENSEFSGRCQNLR
jgi:hypothetical protein